MLSINFEGCGGFWEHRHQEEGFVNSEYPSGKQPSSH